MNKTRSGCGLGLLFLISRGPRSKITFKRRDIVKKKKITRHKRQKSSLINDRCPNYYALEDMSRISGACLTTVFSAKMLSVLDLPAKKHVRQSGTSTIYVILSI